MWTKRLIYSFLNMFLIACGIYVIRLSAKVPDTLNSWSMVAVGVFAMLRGNNHLMRIKTADDEKS